MVKDAEPDLNASGKSDWRVDKIKKELAIQNKDIDTGSVIGLIKHIDKLKDERRAEMNKIDYKITAMNIMMTFAAMSICYLVKLTKE